MIAVHNRDAAEGRLYVHVREVEVLAAALLQLGIQPQAAAAAHDGALLDPGRDIVGEGLSEASNRVMVFFDDTIGDIAAIVVVAGICSTTNRCGG